MNIEQALSAFTGAALSVLLQTVPPLHRWWSKRRGKVLILLCLHIGGAVGLWLLRCKAGLQIQLPITCTYTGLAEIGWTGTMGFVGNQTAYGLGQYGVPAAKGLATRVRARIRKVR